MIKNLKHRNVFIYAAILVMAIVIFLIFFIKNNYKILKTGNNMNNKSIEEIEQYILNISSYKAKISVTVESNKNTNKYVIFQEYISPNISKQTVIEPSNLAGLEIAYDGQQLSINNSKLNLSKIYENYEYVVDNALCLESFIKDYQNAKKEDKSKSYEKDGEYVLETKTKSENAFNKNKKLFIDKNTGNPTKLLIQDVNEKTVVYILYNEIRINDLRENDILAMKTIEPYVRLY